MPNPLPSPEYSEDIKESSMSAMRQKWEYKVYETSDKDSLQPELVILGNDSWELVSATAMFNTWMSKIVYQLFLKRPAA